MEKFNRQLLTIVTEAVLERELVAEFDALGVRGYTITDARGRGGRGSRRSDWAQDGNIRVEIVCEPALADTGGQRGILHRQNSPGNHNAALEPSSAACKTVIDPSFAHHTNGTRRPVRRAHARYSSP